MERSNKELAKLMRENKVVKNGAVLVSVEVWDLICDYLEKSLSVVHCKDCTLHGHCRTEDTMRATKLSDYRCFCGVGKAAPEVFPSKSIKRK